MNYREGEYDIADMSGSEWIWVVLACFALAGIIEKMGWV